MFRFNRQFLFFLFQNIFIGICGLIDTGFGNQINLDSVCVLSAYTVITWVTYCTYSIGSYAYRVVLEKAKMCFYIQVAVSVLVGFFVYVFSSVIPHIYFLTDGQYVLFEQCLKVHSISCPILAVREFLGNYVEYKCKNKQAIAGNIILYVTMIITDAVVIDWGKDLTWLIWGTLLCSIFYSIFELFASGFLKEKFVWNLQDIKMLLKHGMNTCLDRWSGKVATIVFNIFASKLDMQLYAIHSVCYSIGVFTENFTNALFTYQTIVLAKSSSGQERFLHCVKITKKYAIFLFIFAYIVCYGILLFVHGSVPLQQCLFYTGLYCAEIVALLFYEPMRAYLTSEKLTDYLRYSGVCGILVRIPIAISGYYFDLGLFPFAIASALDFSIRGLYLYLAARKYRIEQGSNK